MGKPTPAQLARWGVLAYLPEEKRQEALNMPHGQAKAFMVNLEKRVKYLKSKGRL